MHDAARVEPAAAGRDDLQRRQRARLRGSRTTCNPLTFRAVRVGDGPPPLNNASTPAFIEERRVDGSLVGSRAGAAHRRRRGLNMPLTLSGSATSDGGLALSATAST